MDEFERRLRADAERIHVETPDTLYKRVDAAIEAARAEPQHRSRLPIRLWRTVLIGGAAAMLVVALMDWRSTDTAILPPDATVRTVPEAVPVEQTEFDLQAQPVVLTEPLEEELERLKSDLQKAREGVAEDLRGSF